MVRRDAEVVGHAGHGGGVPDDDGPHHRLALVARAVQDAAVGVATEERGTGQERDADEHRAARHLDGVRYAAP